MSNLIKMKQIKGGTALQNDVTVAKQDIVDLKSGLGEATSDISTMQSDIEIIQGALGLGEGSEGGSVTTQINEAIAAAEDNCYVVTKTADHADDMAAIASVVATPAKGDTCVVKNLIVAANEEKKIAERYSHTGYVYNGEAWEAMDGNYSAENVYFANDLTITANVGVHTVDSTGSKTIETTGKSVKQVMDTLFAQEANPETTQPEIELTASGGSGEVGSTFTLPTATLKLKGVGSYTYGPETGVKVAVGNATISEGTDNSKSNTSEMVLDSTLTLTATNDTNVYTDSAISFSFSAEATHTDGAVPVTNLGNDYEAGQIKSTKLTASKSVSFTGYRSFFYGILDDTEALTSAKIRSLTNGGAYNAAKTVYINASTTNHKRFVVAIPSGSITATRKGLTKAMSTAGMTVEVTGAYVKTAKAVQVKGTTDTTTAVDYDVWVWQPDTIDSGVKHTITLA